MLMFADKTETNRKLQDEYSVIELESEAKQTVWTKSFIENQIKTSGHRFGSRATQLLFVSVFFLNEPDAVPIFNWNSRKPRRRRGWNRTNGYLLKRLGGAVLTDNRANRVTVGQLIG